VFPLLFPLSAPVARERHRMLGRSFVGPTSVCRKLTTCRAT
jgi:hypothetical protein